MAFFQEAMAVFLKADCPKVPTVEKFDAKRYAGKWYEVVRDKNIPFMKGASCTTAKYTLGEDGDIDVTNRAFLKGTYTASSGKVRCKAD